MTINWSKYGIDVSKASGGKMVCPKCSHSRKNKRDKSLSVDLVTGAFNCHYSGCDFKGYAVDVQREKKQYLKPAPRLEKLSKKSIEFFEKRGISNDTTLRFGITEGREFMPALNQEATCICFNYFRNETLINIKFRGPQKSFKLAKDAELTFYNLDAVKSETEIIIVEGEMDCLTLHECGIYNVVSVPNGASGGSMKLEYLDHSWELFENAKSVVLAVDNDHAGLALREELARRIGKDKCFTIDYPKNCKDANDALVAYGKETVKAMMAAKKQWPVEGIIPMDDMFETVLDWYDNGYPPGAKCGIPGLDELLSFAPGKLTIITGIPSHGKDEFTNDILTGLAKNCGWKIADCGFEEEAPETVTKLIEKFCRKSFDFRVDDSQRISVDDFKDGVYFVDQHFHFYNTETIDCDIETILSIAERLVKRYGIKGLRINPWNWIDADRPGGMNETEWVSVVLSKLIRFGRRWGVHIFLIAHTTKMQKDKRTGKYEVPTLYSISGSAHFYNKAHNGIAVYRDESTVDVYVQKVKQSWLGQKGFSTYQYNTFTRQYRLISTNASRTIDRDIIDFTEPNQN